MSTSSRDHPVDGPWTFEPDGDQTQVRFVAEGELSGLMEVFEPVARCPPARRFAGCHRRLRQNVDGG